ncbi:MAG: hypothetical protein NTZ25_00130 [Candidatus Peregrinibacteria bacterium]|nr:hypothetical protein [Candidatus Peregrinibacteria bacterium]
MTKKILFIGAIALVLTAMSLTYLETAFGAVIEGWSENTSDMTSVNLSADAKVADPQRHDALASGSIDMQAEPLDHDILKISVMTIDMSTPVLGMAFHLNYDGDKIKFLKYEPGDFLEQGGDPFYLVQNDAKKNQIVFGETLRRDDKFPKGSGKVADFYFQISKRELLNFNFKQGAVSTLDTVRQDIDKIVWNDLSLDKNGKKITDEILSDTLNSGQNIEVEDVNSPANFGIILVMGIAIIGLSVWIFINNKRQKTLRQSTSI